MARDQMTEFCWRCHCRRLGTALPAKCEQPADCRKEMADTAPIEPRRIPFDFHEIDDDLRFATRSIMGVVAVAIVLALLFA